MDGESHPAERPRLQLKPRSEGAAHQQQQQATKNSPFGGARPREENVSLDQQERLAKKFEEIDLERQQAIESRAPHGAEGQRRGPGEGGQQRTQQQGSYRSGDQQQRGYGSYGGSGGRGGSFQGNGYGGGRQQQFGGNGSAGSYDGRQQGGQGRPSRPGEGYTCKICNVPGHWIQDCPQYVPNSRQGPRQGGFEGGYDRGQGQGSRPVPQGYVCKICNVPGHWIQECPQKQHGSPDRRDGPSRGFEGRGSGFDSSSPHGGHRHQDSHGAGGFSSVTAAYSTLPPEGYVCKICKIPGHFIHQCPDYRKGHEQQDRRRGMDDGFGPGDY